MPDRPVVIASGFFPGRHNAVYQTLRQDFTVKLHVPTGDWPDAQRYVSPALPSPSQQDINAFVEKIMHLLATCDPSRQHEPDPEWLNHVLNIWHQGRSLYAGFLHVHARQPIAAVVSVNDHLAPIRAIVLAAKSVGVPTLYLDHGYSVANLDGTQLKSLRIYPRPRSAIICVDSELTRSYWASLYSDAERPRIEVVGETMDLVDDTISGSTRHLLFCPAWVEASLVTEPLWGEAFEHKAFLRFCRLVTALKKKLGEQAPQPVIKVHPTLAHVIGVNTEEYFRQSARAEGVDNLTIDDGSVSHWLPSTDLVVTSRLSSVNFEALRCGVPAITYLSPLRRALLQDPSSNDATLLARLKLHDLLDEHDDDISLAIERIHQRRAGLISQSFLDRAPSAKGPSDPAARLCQLLHELIE